MTALFLGHMPGCTPLSPCASCEAVTFIRNKLSDEDFQTLLSKVRSALAKNGGPYSQGSPAPLEMSVDSLQLSVRAMMCLQNDNIITIGDLIKKSEAELLRTPNFGRKSLNEVKEELARVGRRLGEVNA